MEERASDVKMHTSMHRASNEEMDVRGPSY